MGMQDALLVRSRRSSVVVPPPIDRTSFLPSRSTYLQQVARERVDGGGACVWSARHAMTADQMRGASSFFDVSRQVKKAHKEGSTGYNRSDGVTRWVTHGKKHHFTGGLYGSTVASR